MAKLSLDTITTGYAAVAALNSNFDAIEVAMENTLSRDGTTPNTMSADLDLNGYNILNQGNPYTFDGGFNWRNAWLTATAYIVGDVVSSSNNVYICILEHTSGTFATDLAALKWQLMLQGVTGGSGTWTEGTSQPNVGWITTGARAFFSSANGGVGVSGVARASDSADSGTPAAIGVVGFGYNDDTFAKPVWGGYFEAKSASNGAGWSGGVEIDSVNNNTFVDKHAYSAIGSNTQFTTGAWIAAGGDPTINPSAADSTWAVSIVPNGAKWGKGIVFKSTSLRVRSYGAYSSMTAIEMAEDQAIDWVNPDGNRASWIASTCGAGQKSLNIAFISGGWRLVDDADAVQLQVSKTASSTSYFSFTGSASGIPILSVVNDAGANADGFYKSAGTGAHYFANGAGQTQFAVVATAGASRFVQATGSTTNPTISASAGHLNVNSMLLASKGVATSTPAIKVADYTVQDTDTSLIFNGGGTIVLTLPAAASFPGRIIYVKTIAAQLVNSASSNVKPISTDTAGTAILAATAGKWAMLQSDGSFWITMMAG